MQADLVRMLAEEVDHADEALHSDAMNSDENKGLRIAAVFIVLSAGLLGGIPPLMMKTFRSPSSPVRLLLRAAASGIILALALIHIIPESIEDMHTLTETLPRQYPHTGGAVVAFGILLMVVLEAATHALLESNLMARSSSTSGSSTPPASSDPEAVKDAEKELAAPNKQASPGLPVCLDSTQHASTPDVHSHSHGHGHAHGEEHDDHHHHHHLPLASAHNTIRQQVMAYMFELGCIFHSVIIGITLGVQTGSKSSMVGMLIALAFHQLLEGVALSSFIIDAEINLIKGLTMIVIYACTSPVGIAIGIGISSSYDDASTTALAVKGIFNGLSGGMLLYIGLVQLLAEDFQRKTLLARAPKLWLRIGCYVALVLGVGAMAILGLWESPEGAGAHASHGAEEEVGEPSGEEDHADHARRLLRRLLL